MQGLSVRLIGNPVLHNEGHNGQLLDVGRHLGLLTPWRKGHWSVARPEKQGGQVARGEMKSSDTRAYLSALDVGPLSWPATTSNCTTLIQFAQDGDQNYYCLSS